MNKGKFYGIGVGPGDPELLTVKAVRLIQTCDTIAVPQSGGSEQAALKIAKEYIGEKPVLHCDLPMTRDKAQRDACHDRAADAICALLDAGRDVAFLTLGDPTIYATSWYIFKRVAARGYDTEIVPGVPSFCAAAAALGRALCEDDEMLHIIPASHGALEQGLDLPGSKVLMKAGKAILEVRDRLAERGEIGSAALVERCGMEGQRLVTDLAALEDPSSYFSIILVREDRA